MNLASNLERTARLFPDNLAVIDGDVRWSYEELNRRSGLLAAGLEDLGIRPGDMVALCAPNSAQWLAFYFAVLKVGAVAVTMSALLTPDEFGQLLALSRPRLVFTDDARLPQVDRARQDAGIQWALCPVGDITLEQLAARAAEPLAVVDRGRDDPACVLFTGGTTGLPKGVLLTHENINTATNNVAAMERSAPADRALCFLPFNHVFGQVHIMNATVLSGGGLVLLPGFELEAMLAAVAEHGVTKLYAVPTVYVRLLQVDDLADRLAGVRYCFSAAASMARELVRQWKEKTGLDIFEAFGMTETASMVTYNHYHRHRVGSVGQPVGTTEVSIRDPQGEPLPQGMEGEICVQGRNVMAGYLGDQAATDKTFFGPWLRTGDLGYLDADGYLFIVDRLKDLIITGGENVSPREVEEFIFQRPEVAECSVVGLPDIEYGERVTAVVVPSPGQAVDPAELKTWLKERLSGFKVPKQYVIVEALPKNPAGKILKRQIKQDLAQGES